MTIDLIPRLIKLPDTDSDTDSDSRTSAFGLFYLQTRTIKCELPGLNARPV